MLWDKAIPAEHKIMEMESGIMLPERTEILTLVLLKAQEPLDPHQTIDLIIRDIK